MTDDLKSCPFCGGRPTPFIIDGRVAGVFCSPCVLDMIAKGTDMGAGDPAFDCTAHWNTRTPSLSTPALDREAVAEICYAPRESSLTWTQAKAPSIEGPSFIENWPYSGTAVDVRTALAKADAIIALPPRGEGQCADCGGNGFSGGIVPKEPDLGDACEVCLGTGNAKPPRDPSKLVEALIKIRDRDFNCSPHQHGMAASGCAETALADWEAGK